MLSCQRASFADGRRALPIGSALTAVRYFRSVSTFRPQATVPSFNGRARRCSLLGETPSREAQGALDSLCERRRCPRRGWRFIESRFRWVKLFFDLFSPIAEFFTNPLFLIGKSFSAIPLNRTLETNVAILIQLIFGAGSRGRTGTRPSLEGV